MNDMFTFGSRIMIFAAVSALILAGVFTIATPLISGQRQKEVQRSLQELIPEASTFKAVTVSGIITHYQAIDAKGTVKGYILPGSGKGYSSTLKTLIAITPTRSIIGVKVLEQQETPGLGTRITEVTQGTSTPWFTAQFVGKKAMAAKIKKDGGSVDAITGATITSRALANIVEATVRSFTIPTKEYK